MISGETNPKLDGKYANIAAARRRTREVLTKLEALKEFESEETSIVVYGSIGRGEITEVSDADWTLLIDGPSDPGHLRVAHRVEAAFVALKLKKPGRAGTFGEMVSSHELIHHIAGPQDTNQNLTRRILLLIESAAITQPLVRERVLRNILNRYIVHDTTVPRLEPPEQLMPHFLLNDVVRYWRTMASDYAAKMWEREAEGWAIRNVKLRFSRKLIFVAGLLICFAFELDPPPGRQEIVSDAETLPERLANYTMGLLGRTPLDVVADALSKWGRAETADKLLGSYDEFLGILSDPERRATLETLKLDDAIKNSVWQQARTASHRFRDAVQQFFLEDNEHLKKLVLRYAIF